MRIVKPLAQLVQERNFCALPNSVPRSTLVCISADTPPQQSLYAFVVKRVAPDLNRSNSSLAFDSFQSSAQLIHITTSVLRLKEIPNYIEAKAHLLGLVGKGSSLQDVFNSPWIHLGQTCVPARHNCNRIAWITDQADDGCSGASLTRSSSRNDTQHYSTRLGVDLNQIVIPRACRPCIENLSVCILMHVSPMFL